MNPMLASDAVEKKIILPCLAQPKIDGVRGWNPNGNMLARSMKPHGNHYTRKFFSEPRYTGLDGELAASDERDPLLCTKTTSATSTRKGEPFLLWHCFDLIRQDTILLPYEERYKALQHAVDHIGGHLRLIPSHLCKSMKEILEWEELWLDAGYEGIILRNPKGMHKQGRSTPTEGGLLRIKRFIEEEARVIGVTEGFRNDNIAQQNELGQSFRSSHQENKVPNGRIGSLQCIILKDSELFKAGQEITVSPGLLTHAECEYFFQHQEEILGRIIKFKHFARGVKDKPRFPTFQSFRALTDMS